MKSETNSLEVEGGGLSEPLVYSHAPQTDSSHGIKESFNQGGSSSGEVAQTFRIPKYLQNAFGVRPKSKTDEDKTGLLGKIKKMSTPPKKVVEVREQKRKHKMNQSHVDVSSRPSSLKPLL